jgi:hypothetical protein
MNDRRLAYPFVVLVGLRNKAIQNACRPFVRLPACLPSHRGSRPLAWNQDPYRALTTRFTVGPGPTPETSGGPVSPLTPIHMGAHTLSLLISHFFYWSSHE